MLLWYARMLLNARMHAGMKHAVGMSTCLLYFSFSMLRWLLLNRFKRSLNWKNNNYHLSYFIFTFS